MIRRKANQGVKEDLRFCRDSALRRSISTKSSAIRMPASKVDWPPTKFDL